MQGGGFLLAGLRRGPAPQHTAAHRLRTPQLGAAHAGQAGPAAAPAAQHHALGPGFCFMSAFFFFRKTPPGEVGIGIGGISEPVVGWWVCVGWVCG